MEDILLEHNLKEFLEANKQNFESYLLNQAVNVREKINDILRVGDIDLINNAHKLTSYIINGNEQEKLRAFAKQEGVAWATFSLTLSFKLEWVQAIRRTLWHFIQKYNDELKSISIESFFQLEKQINNQIDYFLNEFFINYSTYKDALISSQRKVVEALSVPIIPITPTICILPLIGSVDTYRTSILEEKVLTEIGRLHIHTLIMDLSGISDMETEVIDHLMKVIYGTSMMGCSTVITGLRPDVVRQMIQLGVQFGHETKTYATLQQALNQYLIN
ncbi:Anti-anti-sigma regulatory factor (antagonist of anti-sigma factor) [Psychrobacillus sp. OK028]|nr:STAS domain-containing protein [Psychrobacillus sp. OK028]SDN08028.1 Anti-anti-sigma regulatory factor (antagonist of anti-sigma factor) [Psychrobacillus sp. OK028]